MQKLTVGSTCLKVSQSSRVPQVLFLGPLLFVIYINELPEAVNSNVKLFVMPDTQLLSIINVPEENLRFQKDSDAIYE